MIPQLEADLYRARRFHAVSKCGYTLQLAKIVGIQKNKEKQVLYKENPIMIFIKPPFLDILCLDEKKSMFIKPFFNYF